jgi:hypothetical protein
LGFTNKSIISEILINCTPQRPEGKQLAAVKQPSSLPGVQERWKFIEQTLAKAPFIKIVPMLGSMGCPYTCSFCIDSTVPYQPVDFEVIKSDLRFLLTKFKKPMVAWHDPNFGIKFDDNMDAIASAVPAKSFRLSEKAAYQFLLSPI